MNCGKHFIKDLLPTQIISENCLQSKHNARCNGYIYFYMRECDNRFYCVIIRQLTPPCNVHYLQAILVKKIILWREFQSKHCEKREKQKQKMYFWVWRHTHTYTAIHTYTCQQYFNI